MTDKIKSDGGSSDYYKIKLPKRVLKDNGDGTFTIETGDIIRYALSNDFNLGNIFKVLIRWGKKDGIDYQYDRNKIVYFADDHVASKAPVAESEETTQTKVIVWYENEGKMPDWVDPSTIIKVRKRDGTVVDKGVRLDWYRWDLTSHMSTNARRYDGDIMEWTYADPTN